MFNQGHVAFGNSPIPSGGTTFASSGMFSSGVFVSGVSVIARINDVGGPDIVLRPGYGMSGFAFDTTGQKNLYAHTSGFLQESGTAFNRRFLYPHDSMVAAGLTLKSNGLYTTVASGTAADPNDNKRFSSQYTTSAAATAVATIGALVTQHLQPHHNIDFRGDFKMMVSGGASANFWMGLLNMNPGTSGFETVVRDTRVQCAALWWGLGYPTWYFVTKGTNATAQSGAVPAATLPIPDTAQWHDVHIFSHDGGTTWHLEIDNKWVASQATQVPASGANLGCITQLGGTSNSFRLSYQNTRVNSPNPMPFTV